MNDLIKNKTSIGTLDLFNESFSSIAISLCPLLNKFSIYIVSHLKTNHANETLFNENDTFSYYVRKEEEDASSTYAEIIVNEDLCNNLSFTIQEMLAAIAHEIGHIIMFFRADKDVIQSLEEFCSDNYACQMGLATPLYSLLNKLINSGLYSEAQIKIMQKRLYFINIYIESHDCYSK